MTLLKKLKLKKAQYVHRGDDNDGYTGVYCGPPDSCDYCHLITEDDSEDSYRICERLGIQVGYYDSCKYYDNSKSRKVLDDLISEYYKLLKK